MTALPHAADRARTRGMDTPKQRALRVQTPDLGDMRIPRVTALRTATRRAPDLSPVTKSTQAWLAMGEELIEILAPATEGRGSDVLPELLDGALESVAPHWYRRGLVRRGLRQAAAAAVTDIYHLRPAGKVFCGTEVTAMAEEADLPAEATGAQPIGARLAWWSPTGENPGLVIDRLHHTHRAGLVMDQWMRTQVTADLALGRAVAGETFDGVRVIAHMAYASCLHVLPDFTVHVLGQCPKCTIAPWGGA